MFTAAALFVTGTVFYIRWWSKREARRRRVYREMPTTVPFQADMVRVKPRVYDQDVRGGWEA